MRLFIIQSEVPPSFILAKDDLKSMQGLTAQDFISDTDQME